MKILSLDPSSTCCGYAVMTGADRAEEFGILWPEKRRSSYEARSMSLAGQVYSLAYEFRPQAIVIEIPSTHVNHRRNGGAGAGLTAYAFAVGAAAGWLNAVPGGITAHYVNVDEWTGKQKKAARLAVVRGIFPRYGRECVNGFDKGGDAGDALALGRWWFRNREGA